VKIFQQGNLSIPYNSDWYELYQWQQIGIAFVKREHPPLDQFGSTIIPKLVELFCTGREKEQEFIFSQILRTDSSSIEYALKKSDDHHVEFVKKWAIERFDEFSYGALFSFSHAFHVGYDDISLQSPCNKMLYTIGDSAFHLLYEPMSQCEKRIELILNILPTTTGNISEHLIRVLIDYGDHELLARLCIRFLEYYNPPKYCLIGEKERVTGSRYLSNIFSEKNRPDLLLRLLQIINQYQPGGIKEISAVNFNIVTQWLLKQFNPRNKTELDLIVMLWDSFGGKISNDWNDEKLACYYIGQSDWINLKELGIIGIQTLLHCFVRLKRTIAHLLFLLLVFWRKNRF